MVMIARTGDKGDEVTDPWEKESALPIRDRGQARYVMLHAFVEVVD